MPNTSERHRRSHICDRCNKTFQRAEHLNRHLLAHDKRKPFSCKACGTSYGRNDVLQRHLRKCPQHLYQQNANEAMDTSNTTDAFSMSTQQSTTALGMTGDALPEYAAQEQTGQLISLPRDPSNEETNISLYSQVGNHSGPILEGYGSTGLGADPRDPGSSLSLHAAFQNQGLSTNFPGNSCFDDIFLEDSLLFQFNYNHSGLTVPPTPNLYATNQNSSINANRLQVVTPESAANSRVDSRVYNALEVSVEDLHAFYDNLDEGDCDSDLCGFFQNPSLSRTLRCLVAYYQHFDPHAPLVHFASFSVSKSHPALVLIMLAIGAVHLSEHKFAQSAYEAACMLLAQHDKRKLQKPDHQFQLWYAQTTVLCAQFGVFAGGERVFQNAQHHLFTAQTAMHQAIEEIRRKGQVQVELQDWETWIFLESCCRVVSWLFVLSGVILAWNPTAMTIVPPLPCPIPSPSDESVWHAVTEAEWHLARQMDASDKTVDLWTLSKSVFQAKVPESCARTSAFTLLSLIGAFLTNVCTRRRLNIDWNEAYHPDYVAWIEAGLATWEGLWRRHPRAEQSSTRLDHPLLNHCLSLLGSTYYQLYLGDELYKLKKIAEDPRCTLPIPGYPMQGRAYKVIRYAANSWLVRAKLGISYLHKTGGLLLGSQALITAYESALILAWWIHLQADSLTPVGGQTEEDRAAATSVQRIFDEILNELDEQGVSYESTGAASLSPIDFYVSLLNGWVWKCSAVIEDRLRCIKSRLER